MWKWQLCHPRQMSQEGGLVEGAGLREVLQATVESQTPRSPLSILSKSAPLAASGGLF